MSVCLVGHTVQSCPIHLVFVLDLHGELMLLIGPIHVWGSSDNNDDLLVLKPHSHHLSFMNWRTCQHLGI